MSRRQGRCHELKTVPFSRFESGVGDAWNVSARVKRTLPPAGDPATGSKIN
jgi:hypothetical protein